MTSSPPIQQIAALPYRVGAGGCEILLITSRESRRWIVPKGHRIAGLDDYLAAAREAFEEAGVIGHPYSACLGSFGYLKVKGNGLAVPAVVAVYPLAVATLLESWPEPDRERRWFARDEAAQAVAELELQAIIREFRP